VCAIRREKKQHDEVGDEQPHVESIRVVKALERGIEKMLADVLSETPRTDETREKS
jgi:hypothetical protein